MLKMLNTGGIYMKYLLRLGALLCMCLMICGCAGNDTQEATQASDREEKGRGVLVGAVAPDGYSHPVPCTLFLTPMA